jgi:hypothetical protein
LQVHWKLCGLFQKVEIVSSNMIWFHLISSDLIFEDFDFPTLSSTLPPVPSNQIEANTSESVKIITEQPNRDVRSQRMQPITLTERRNSPVTRRSWGEMFGLGFRTKSGGQVKWDLGRHRNRMGIDWEKVIKRRKRKQTVTKKLARDWTPWRCWGRSESIGEGEIC